jgi:hypothetical protein
MQIPRPFSFHVGLAELPGTDMPAMIERLKPFQREIASVSEPRLTGKGR